MRFIDFVIYLFSNPIGAFMLCLTGLWVGAALVYFVTKAPSQRYVNGLRLSNKILREKNATAVKDAAYWKQQAEEMDAAKQEQGRSRKQ